VQLFINEKKLPQLGKKYFFTNCICIVGIKNVFDQNIFGELES
jgi:hypothetical protein